MRSALSARGCERRDLRTRETGRDRRSEPGREVEADRGMERAEVGAREVVVTGFDEIRAGRVEAGRDIAERGAVHVPGGERGELRCEVSDPIAGARGVDVGNDSGQLGRGHDGATDGEPGAEV